MAVSISSYTTTGKPDYSAYTSWREFLKLDDKTNVPEHIDTPSWASRDAIKSVEARVKDACAQMGEGGVLHGLGLSEGEVAAVLLCTMDETERGGLFAEMQTALLKTPQETQKTQRTQRTQKTQKIQETQKTREAQ